MSVHVGDRVTFLHNGRRYAEVIGVGVGEVTFPDGSTRASIAGELLVAFPDGSRMLVAEERCELVDSQGRPTGRGVADQAEADLAYYLAKLDSIEWWAEQDTGDDPRDWAYRRADVLGSVDMLVQRFPWLATQARVGGVAVPYVSERACDLLREAKLTWLAACPRPAEGSPYAGRATVYDYVWAAALRLVDRIEYDAHNAAWRASSCGALHAVIS